MGRNAHRVETLDFYPVIHGCYAAALHEGTLSALWKVYLHGNRSFR